MPTAIIIGFEYTYDSLTGCIIDIYNAYKWCSSFRSTIHVLTDIKIIRNSDSIKQAIDRNFAGPDLTTFYDDIPEKSIVSNKNGLLVSIINILNTGISDNKLIIYYSGHGVRDSMVIPDNTLLPFIELRDSILDRINSYVEVFWILDCCNPNGLHLPYKLTNNVFSLSPSKIECVSQPVLLITSSNDNEKSIATKYGSVFSRYLFKFLTQLNSDVNLTVKKKLVSIPITKNRNLRRLIGNLSSGIRKMHTGYAQTVSVYSSYIVDPVLWMWIGSCKSYDIVGDIGLSTLVVRTSDIVNINPHDNMIVNIKSRNRQKANNKLPAKTSLINKYDTAGFQNPYDSLYPEIK